MCLPRIRKHRHQRHRNFKFGRSTLQAPEKASSTKTALQCLYRSLESEPISHDSLMVLVVSDMLRGLVSCFLTSSEFQCVCPGVITLGSKKLECRNRMDGHVPTFRFLLCIVSTSFSLVHFEPLQGPVAVLSGNSLSALFRSLGKVSERPVHGPKSMQKTCLLVSF